MQTPVPLLGSTLKVTGLPDPPPVAVSAADWPTVPGPGAVNVMACEPSVTVLATSCTSADQKAGKVL